MLLSRFAPEFAEQISDRVGRVGSLLLLIDGTIVAIVAFFVLGMAVGHALGGPKPAERAVRALASAARHPGIALAILTANLPDHKSALAAIQLSVVVSMIVPIPICGGSNPGWRCGRSPHCDELSTSAAAVLPFEPGRQQMPSRFLLSLVR
jgi:hypothetical protein